MPTSEPYTDEDGMLIADRTVSFRCAAGAEVPPAAEENHDRLLTDAVVDGDTLVADGTVSFRTPAQEHPGHANQKAHGGGGGGGSKEAALHQMVKDENKAGGRLRVRAVRRLDGKIVQSLTGKDRLGRHIDMRGTVDFLHDQMADPDRLPKPDYGPAWKGLVGLDLRKRR